MWRLDHLLDTHGVKIWEGRDKHPADFDDSVREIYNAIQEAPNHTYVRIMHSSDPFHFFPQERGYTLESASVYFVLWCHFH